MSDVPAAVSVIIPCFRCASTIHRAVRSVEMQKRRPMEVILVDDASSDDTLKTLRELEEAHPGWVRVISLPVNCGPGTARNVGWTQAMGDFVAFLDADDVWHPDKILVQYAWMLENPHAALSSHETVVLCDGEVLDFVIHRSGDVSREVKVSRQLIRNHHSTRTVMVRRSVQQRFEDGKRYSEDYLLWTSIALSGGRCYFLGVPLAASYKHDFGEGGLSGNLWKMQKGNWDSYVSLCKAKLISRSLFVLCSVVSAVRYLRRLLLVSWRQIA